MRVLAPSRARRDPGSIFVFRAQVPDEPRLRFDYRDARNVAFVAIRIGPTVVIASLLDWGATADGMSIRTVETARQLDLHPAQFGEVASAIAYASAQFVGEFMYSVQQEATFDVLEPVLIRDAEAPDAPAFAPMSVRGSAEVQAVFMGMALEDIYDDEEDVVWTCVTNPDGTPNEIPLDTVAMGTTIITPLRAAREQRNH
jgi:hypothetical protein